MDKLYGRIGNFINVEAYGTETTLPWRMGIYEGNNYIEVHPTFFYEMLVTISIFIVLTLKRSNRKFSGEFTYIYLLGYGLARVIIEGMRTDSLMFGPIRISQVVSAILIGIALTLYIKKRKKKEDKI